MRKIIFSLFVVALVVAGSFAFAQEQPETLRARVSSVTANSVVIYLDGWNPSGETCTLFRDSGTGNETRINVGTASFWRDTVPAGATYSYRLVKSQSGEIGTASVNATIRPGTIVKGVGWSAMDASGIGWISINSQSQEPQKSGTHSSVPYGIYADESGEFHGVMWAGHSSTNGWGWLSLNSADLIGCPQAPCTARVGGDGKIYGWARFTNTTIDDNSWSGWVNLRSGENYGLCFGEATGQSIDILNKGYYSGSSCKGNGSASNPILTGAAWAGLNSEEPGGWIVFASSSIGIINPITSSTIWGVRIQPDPPHNVAIRDIKSFWANLPVMWYVDNTYGGNSRYGTVMPPQSGDGVYVEYKAPKTLPNPANTTIKVSSTVSANPGIDEDPLTVVPPYSLSCIPEGNTAIRLIVTKNYKSENYFSTNKHRSDLRGGISSPPPTIIASSTTGPLTSFLHTGLKEKQTYHYDLTITFDDLYVIKTPIISCQTGASPLPVGGITNLNAYGNTSKSIWVNWKDESKLTTPYEFEVQKMRITPDRTLRLQFQSTGTTKVAIAWENKTLWTPYIQRLYRSSDGGRTFNLVAGQIPYWQGENPPTSTIQYSFSDAVVMGTSYQYKLEVCSSLDLTDAYSAPVKGGTEKPNLACVSSEAFNYLHTWSGGETKVPGLVMEATASLIGAAQNATIFGYNIIHKTASVISDGFRTALNYLAGIFNMDSKKTFAQIVEEPKIDAYFMTTVITKNPSYYDEELEADNVYLYRVSILSDDPLWSEYRAAKTLKDDLGGPTENRPVCTRNSFCDANIQGVKTKDLSESSEQQCYVNKDCVNVGRSDQGFQER